MLQQKSKREVIEKLQTYFYDERGEALGLIGAENFYEFIIKEIGPHIYNRALADARQLIEQQAEALKEEMFVLEKQIDEKK
ncbi:DUF2164 domain-containing protein [Pullulanibacillus pueri]|uniref:DUF2164 domain-containing protein n=1 Tax=Pullulanibacillus pueri TaxID=1437324 RepID=UPI00166CF61D|nr:DUF2164 domain-containing protein [Pullulanibacillus pueri]